MSMTGDELRGIRTRKGWTQSQLATYLKVSPQYIGMMEREEKMIQPHIEQAARGILLAINKHKDFVPDTALYQEAKQAVLVALKQHPDLCSNGFPHDGYKEDPFDRAKYYYASRAELFSDESLAQVATAIRWIDSVKKTKDFKCGSYGAKHKAEDWGGENGYSSYVANGALIAAAIYRKVRIRRELNNPNAELALDPDPMPEPKAGTFTHWLLDQKGRYDPVGDVAREAARDRTFPLNTSGGPKLRAHLRNHLERYGACDAALQALEEALAEWRALKKRSSSRGS